MPRGLHARLCHTFLAVSVLPSLHNDDAGLVHRCAINLSAVRQVKQRTNCKNLF